MGKLKWTGERVIPDEMREGDNPEHWAHLDRILKEHLARYNWAKTLCEGESVLDASCGSGYGTSILSERARLCRGVDISKEAVDYAGKRFGSDKVEFSVRDLSKGWEYPLDNYDVIVSFETIEHIENPRVFLENVKNRFQKKFIFSIPLNNPSEFHKEEYTLKEAVVMMHTIFDNKNIVYYTQEKDLIIRGLDENSRFILGVVTK